MMAARFQDYDKTSFNSSSCSDAGCNDVDCYHNNFFAIKPRENNERAGFDQDIPQHLRGLKESELEFLTTLRDKSGHRCKKEETSPSTFLKPF